MSDDVYWANRAEAAERERDDWKAAWRELHDRYVLGEIGDSPLPSGTVAVKYHPEIGVGVYVVDREGGTRVVYSAADLHGEVFTSDRIGTPIERMGRVVFIPTR